MHKSRRWTAALEEHFIHQWTSGVSIREMEAEFRLGCGGVYAHAYGLGLSRRPTGFQPEFSQDEFGRRCRALGGFRDLTRAEYRSLHERSPVSKSAPLPLRALAHLPTSSTC
jgi:hypothetical protein